MSAVVCRSYIASDWLDSVEGDGALDTLANVLAQYQVGAIQLKELITPTLTERKLISLVSDIARFTDRARLAEAYLDAFSARLSAGKSVSAQELDTAYRRIHLMGPGDRA